MMPAGAHGETTGCELDRRLRIHDLLLRATAKTGMFAR
jgi:hypothetical protein